MSEENKPLTCDELRKLDFGTMVYDCQDGARGVVISADFDLSIHWEEDGYQRYGWHEKYIISRLLLKKPDLTKKG